MIKKLLILVLLLTSDCYAKGFSMGRSSSFRMTKPTYNFTKPSKPIVTSKPIKKPPVNNFTSNAATATPFLFGVPFLFNWGSNSNNSKEKCNEITAYNKNDSCYEIKKGN